jgi:hypothetical protein
MAPAVPLLLPAMLVRVMTAVDVVVVDVSQKRRKRTE